MPVNVLKSQQETSTPTGVIGYMIFEKRDLLRRKIGGFIPLIPRACGFRTRRPGIVVFGPLISGISAGRSIGVAHCQGTGFASPAAALTAVAAYAVGEETGDAGIPAHQYGPEMMVMSLDDRLPPSYANRYADLPSLLKEKISFMMFRKGANSLVLVSSLSTLLATAIK